MVKQSPSRNHRSKGIKVKHVLQICVLLAVCFWLIYQVKHSHDKKKSFDEHDARMSLETHVSGDVLKFGRKDLQPRLEETTLKNEKGDEQAEEETGGEDEEEEKQHEEEDDKIEEKEDEGLGGGDYERDEHDQEKPDMETEREEDLIDGDEREEGIKKEAEEKNSEHKDGQNGNKSSSEDSDLDGGSSRNTHEAREENYKGDDASSAVTNEKEAITTETERGMENSSNVNTEITGREDESKSTNTTGLKAEKGEMAENGVSLNMTGKEDNGSEIGSFKSEGSSLLNSSPATQSNNQTGGNNSTEGSSETNNILLQNRTGMKADASEAQNATVGGTTSEDSNLQTIALGQQNDSNVASNNNQTDSNLMTSGRTQNAEAAVGESSNSSSTTELTVAENVTTQNASGEVEGHPGSPTTKENVDAAGNENSETSNGTDNSWDTGNSGVIRRDPETGIGGSNNENAAAQR